jgi:curved DNA-binding protein CbpA
MNPYQELDVPKDADAATIKRAYRKKASKHHPDKQGGDKEKFQLVKRAYEVLSDPSQRNRYDKTGEIPDANTIQDQAFANIVHIVVQLIDQVDAIESLDLKASVTKTIQTGISERQREREKTITRIKKFERAKSRLSSKSGTNPMAFVIDAQIEKMQDGVKIADDDIELAREMLRLWANYEYRFDAPVPREFRSFFSTSTSV